jgi:TRAP-type C4-dicarboxylate transport system substrate-binding protein
MASFQKSGDAAEKILNYVFNEIYTRSGETIKVDYYPTGTLCSQSNMLDGVMSDTADMGYMQVSDFGSRLPEISMLEYPGIYFASAPAISYAFMEYLDTYNPAEFQDFVLLSPTWGTLGTICENSGPIRSPSDLKGLTIRAAGNMAKSITAFGGVPTDLAITDCYEALRTGVIDGIMTKPVAIGSFKLQEVLKYGIDYPLYNNGGLYIMNKDVYESLSDRQRDAIDSAWKDAFDLCISKWQNDLEKEPARWTSRRKWRSTTIPPTPKSPYSKTQSRAL